MTKTRITHHTLRLLTLAALLVVALGAQASRFGRMNRNGIYYSWSDNNVITLSGGVNYYFGDLETKELFKSSQLGGFGTVGYRYQFSQYAAIGINFSGGVMRGNDFYRYQYNSTFGETELLYTCFPIPDAGLYISTGAGMTLSKVHFRGTSSAGIAYNNNYICYSPVLPISLGYMFSVGDQGRLGVQLSYRLALLDKPSHTLDGYPFIDSSNQIIGEKDSQNLDGYISFSINYEILF